jgi:ATP-dependent RNA helicase DDX27
MLLGGLSNLPQEAALRTNPDIVVATPGRMIDHLLNSKAVGLEEVEYLVIDEADRMLQIGFMEALQQIVKFLPKGRQSLLFSATMTEDVDRLIQLSLDKPIRVKVDNTQSVAKNVLQEFIKVKAHLEESREAILLGTYRIHSNRNFLTSISTMHPYS